MPDILIDSKSFFYELDDYTPSWRDSDVIFIQHGVGRSLNFFTHWIPLLAGDFQVVRRDMRGHGRSFDPGPDYAWSIDDLLDDIIRFLDAMGIEKLHYIGESAGGVLGLAFAARWPDRLHSLTAISAPGAIPQKNLDAMVKSTGLASMQAAIEKLPFRDWVTAQAEVGGLTMLNSRHKEWVIAEWEKNERYNLGGIIGILPQLDWRSLLPGIVTPTLLLCPTRSPLTSAEDQREMASMMPNANLEIIDGRGHEIYVDKADACIAAFRKFIASLRRD